MKRDAIEHPTMIPSCVSSLISLSLFVLSSFLFSSLSVGSVEEKQKQLCHLQSKDRVLKPALQKVEA